VEPTAEEQPTSVATAPAGGPDLAALERIEGELHAVERALEQVDQGVYEGFAGLGAAVTTGGGAAADSVARDPS